MYKKLLLGALGVVAAVEYRRYMAFVDTVDITTKNLKLSKDAENIKVDFQLVIVNSSTKSVNIKSLTGSIFSGSIKVGDFKINQSSVIAANKTNTIPCVALINMQNISKNFKNYNPEPIIKLDTNTIISFDLVGLVNIPIRVKNTTSFDAKTLIMEFKSLINNFSNLFLRK